MKYQVGDRILIKDFIVLLINKKKNKEQFLFQLSDEKKIKWSALAFMAFSTVWGFGNVLNGFIYFNGIQVVLSWVLMFGLYFIPYALMVGELGSAFKNTGSTTSIMKGRKKKKGMKE